ncbi:MAG: FliH/SctL family protein [Gudongella sp.]|nr:FliH/SctL family protein [Gudongella sp.]
MELSYKIIKKRNLNFSGEAVQINSDKIVYKREVKDFDSDRSNTNIEKNEDDLRKKPVLQSKEEAMQDFLDGLEKTKEKMMQDIISEANEQARDIKERALEEGYMEGHSRGYRKGIEESVREGENIKKKAISVLMQCEEEAEKYFKLKENKIIKLAGDMAKLIVNHEIDTDSETIIDMIKPIIQDYKRGGMVVISCKNSHQKLLKENIKVLNAINPELEFIILKNPNLEENTVTLEYQNQIIDFNISDQIKAMVEELQNLEV